MKRIFIAAFLVFAAWVTAGAQRNGYLHLQAVINIAPRPEPRLRIVFPTPNFPAGDHGSAITLDGARSRMTLLNRATASSRTLLETAL